MLISSAFIRILLADLRTAEVWMETRATILLQCDVHVSILYQRDTAVTTVAVLAHDSLII